MTHGAGWLACGWLAALLVAAPASARTQDGPEAARQLIAAGKHAEALSALESAGPAGDPAAAANIELLRGTALRALGRLPEAAAAAGRAQRIAEAARNHALTARALLQLATLSSDRGDDAAAEIHLQAALGEARASSDRVLPLSVLEALGRNARARGDNTAALTHLGAAIDAAVSTGNVELIVRARGARSATLLGLARFDEALADAQAAYDILPPSAAPRQKASATFALAQVQAHLWNLDRAAVLWTEAIEQYQKAGLQIGVSLSTKQRMETWFALGDLDRAAADGAEALRLFERTGSAGTTPELFARLALIEARRGHHAEARAYAARVQVQDGPRRRFTENDLGLTAMFLGDHAIAIQRFDSVLQQSLALGDLEYTWRALHMRGRVRLMTGQLQAAEEDLRRAIATLERMRRTLPESGMRAAFMSDRRDVYATLAATLVRGARGADSSTILASLAVADQSRARSLIEQIAESQLRRSDPSLERIRAEEAALSARLTALQQKAAAAGGSGVMTELARAEAEYQALVIKLRRESDAYRRVVDVEAVTQETLLAVTRPGEVLVSYLFTFDGGLAWAIRDGRVIAFRVPDRRHVESQVRLFTALVRGADVEGLQAVGTSLYASLLGPAQAMLNGATRLTVIPDGPLHRLPFALLRSPRGGWLAETLPASLAPSATVLSTLRARSRAGAPGAVAAFAADGTGTTRAAALIDPGARTTLEHAAREVSDVARVLRDSGAVQANRRADEAAVKGAGLDKFRVLHFAAHAAVDETSPRRSAIVFTPGGDDDGLLQLNEIAALDLNARLVVAAACRSQMGRSVGGEGLMSLSRAFLQAGADAVVAALWDVDDAQTRRFMRFFYDALRQGRPTDEALRAAQRAMLAAGGRSAAPENWAGFVLTGAATEPVFSVPPAAPLPRVRWHMIVALAGIAALLLARRREEPSGAAVIGQ